MCIALVTYLSPSSNLLQDSDTSQIIAEINKQHDPWRWFHHDWPLGNHFYRPLVADLFELEIRLHPRDSYKWGLTCDFLAVITTLGLFWMLREVTDNPLVSTLSAGLFVLWQVNSGDWLSPPCVYLAGIVLAFGLWRQRRRPGLLRVADRSITLFVRKRHVPLGRRTRALLAIGRRMVVGAWQPLAVVLPAALLWYWLGKSEIHGFRPLGFRMLAWIPGRTASMMTAFAFISLGAFARYMRLLPRRRLAATALDKPNTRSTEPVSSRKPSFFWPVLSLVMLAGALLCYEQAVMIPPLLGLIGLAWYFRGTVGRWWLWGLPFGAVLVAYLVVRYNVIPHNAVFYWQEQHRTTKTAIDALFTYLLPFWSPFEVVRFLATQSSILFFMTLSPWGVVLDTVAAASAIWQMRRRWLLAGFGWLASTLAYAPMAWFKEFEHYHYWSMAFRAFFDVMMAWIALDLTVIAFSPRGRQAPQRRVLAPGSLPRP
ncbi:MAG: hypothetical protein ACYC96_06840 [Fimbriimonadaceae bacterium]